MSDNEFKKSADIGVMPPDAMYRAYNAWFKNGSHGFFFRWNGEAWMRTTIPRGEVINIDRSRRQMLERNQQIRIRNARQAISR